MPGACPQGILPGFEDCEAAWIWDAQRDWRAGVGERKRDQALSVGARYSATGVLGAGLCVETVWVEARRLAIYRRASRPAYTAVVGQDELNSLLQRCPIRTLP